MPPHTTRCPAGERIGTLAARQDVVPGAPFERVRPGLANEHVVLAVTLKHVIARTGHQHVPPRAPETRFPDFEMDVCAICVRSDVAGRIVAPSPRKTS